MTIEEPRPSPSSELVRSERAFHLAAREMSGHLLSQVVAVSHVSAFWSA